MPDQPIAIGIIGAGIMGERMLTAILADTSGAVRVAGIWDPSEAAMRRIAAAFPQVTRCPDADAVIQASECVYVASPPASHLGYGRAALAAGCTVFGEKPLAVDLAEARTFVAEAGGRGAVNFPFASSLGVTALGRWIADGVVGRPTGLQIEVAFADWPRSWQRDAVGWLDRPAEGGFTREVVSHFLFLSRRLIGPIRDLKATVSFPEPGRSERAIDATFYAGDVPVTLSGHVGRTDRDDSNTWTLAGDRGAIRLRDWAIAEQRSPDGTFEPMPNAKPNEEARPIALRHQLAGVARLTRGEAHHLATLQEALDVQEVVEAILASPSPAAAQLP